MNVKESLINLTKPTVFFKDTDGIPSDKYIMVTHDQDIDRRIMQEAAALIKRGHTILIICLSHHSDDVLEQIEGIYVHRIGLGKIVPDCKVYWFYQQVNQLITRCTIFKSKFVGILQKFNWQLYKVLLLLIYRCKSIHCPLPFDFCFKSALDKYTGSLIIAHDLPALKAAALRATELNVPLLYDSHELYSQQKVFSGYQKRLLDNRTREFLTKCSKVITVSADIAKYMESKQPSVHVDVIMNAHPYHTLSKTVSIHQMIHKPIDEKIILFQGGMLKNRNLENLIKGFLLFNKPGVHLVFLGPHDSKLLEAMKLLIARANNYNVFFLDAVPQKDLLNITSTATFGVIPYLPCDLNTKFCMPNKLFEYIQAELPILYHSELVAVNKLLSEFPSGGLKYDLSTPKNIAQAFTDMLSKDLNDYVKSLKSIKQHVCWETEEEKFMQIVADIKHENYIN